MLRTVVTAVHVGGCRAQAIAVVAPVLAAVLLVTGCAADDTDTAAPTSSTTAVATSPPPSSTNGDEVTTSSVGGTTPSTVSSSGTTGSTSVPTLPGEPFEGFAEAGDRLIVVGVAHDDSLNVRVGPGTGYPVAATLAPTATGVVATGDARLLDQSLWYGVTVAGEDGWANAAFLAFEGGVDDVTSEIVASLGEIPTAETMLDLGLLVAEDRSATDVESRVVVVVGPTVGDLGEVTYDVIGLADDSLYGVRLHVFGQPLPGGEGFGLGSVEQTLLCGRGADPSGRCV